MFLFRVLLLSIFLFIASKTYAKLPLLVNGKTDYVIVLPEKATAYEILAAKELQKFLLQSSNAVFPIKTDNAPFSGKEIIIGVHNRHLKKVKFTAEPFTNNDGFIIETKNKCLVIAGASDIATFYAVATFLESYVSCRWYTSTTILVPKHKDIMLPEIRDKQQPVLSMREIFYKDYFFESSADSLFTRRLKLNGSHNLPPAEKSWGPGWSHSFYFYMPPGKYFASHPEYYSLVDGKRSHKARYGSVELDAQLCLTNESMFNEFVNNLATEMEKHPSAQNWSLSQMDGHLGACQCEPCEVINKREGTPMGSVLYFVNKVAAKFPDKTISTLAYTYTRKPPLNMRPEKNVSIVLCNIESPRMNAIKLVEDAKEHVAFRNDLQGWAALTSNLIVWDYVIQFERLISPYPNFSVFQKNLQYYLKNNVHGIFWQGNREVGGEFAELRAYLLSKLSWDPYCNVDSVMNDFLHGYYGPASTYIGQYINISTKALQESGIRLSMDETAEKHKDGYLSEQYCKKYTALFLDAEKAVAGNAELLGRVQLARLSVLFAELELGYGSIESQKSKAELFFAIAGSGNIKMLNEVKLDMNDFKERLWERWRSKPNK